MWASGVRRRSQDLLARMATPQLKVAVFVLTVGMLLNLEPLAIALIDPIPITEKIGTAIAVAIFLIAYGQVTWPMIFGGLGQHRLIIRTLTYAVGVGMFCVIQGPRWFDISFLAVALLAATLPVALAVVGITLSVGAVVWGALEFGMTGTDAFDHALSALLLGAVFYALLRVATLLRFVEAGREAAEQMAIVEERLRMSRDLHDVAVHSFTAIGLKAELADRVFDSDPQRARVELAEIKQSSTTGLTQVRSLVQGYRHAGLAQTLAEVDTVLRAAGVPLTTQICPDQLPDTCEQVLCWVIKEGVTNALRHATPTTVTISIAADAVRTRLRVVNDGVLPTPPGRRRGNGLAGLSERLHQVGGSCTSLRTEDNRFVLTAHVPRDRSA